MHILFIHSLFLKCVVEIGLPHSSFTVFRSFSLDVEVRPRDVLLSKRILQNKDSPTKGALAVKTIKTFSHCMLVDIVAFVRFYNR